MANLTAEIQKMVKEQCPFLATTDENSYPKVGPKVSLHVLDEAHLVYYEHTFRHTYHNLQHNHHAAVAVVDR